jgi:multimeric flavodoxin WrbA
MQPRRITILNGDPDPGSAFQAYLRDLAGHLRAGGHQVTPLELRDLHLAGCCGCWGCWVRTPGQCVRGDDSALVCRTVLGGDLLLLASPVTMGFTTSLLKRALDQMIPVVHPHFVMEGGELHHRARYAAYPVFALLLAPGPDTDAEDLRLTTAIWARTSRNLKSTLAFTAVADRPAQELAHALVAAA